MCTLFDLNITLVLGLVTDTARTATRLAAGQPLAEIVPARLAELVTGATKSMTSTKLMTVASIALLAGMAAWGALGMAAQAPDDRGTAPAAVAAVDEPPTPALALASMPAPQAAPPSDVDPMTSYPFTLNPDKVREYPQLAVIFRDFELTTEPAAVVPIDCERGTTGVMIIGNGKFQFKPEANKAIEGHFRAVMLRFNPADQPAIISFETGKQGRDVGTVEMSRQMLQTAIRHCYQSSGEKLGHSRPDVQLRLGAPPALLDGVALVEAGFRPASPSVVTAGGIAVPATTPASQSVRPIWSEARAAPVSK